MVEGHGEVLGAAAAAGGEVGAEGVVVSEAGEGCGDGGRVVGVDGEDGVGADFGEGAFAGGDDGGSEGHGFEHGEAEAFVEGGEDDGSGALDEGGEGFGGEVVDLADAAVAGGSVGEEGEFGFGLPGAGADDDEGDVEGG